MKTTWAIAVAMVAALGCKKDGGDNAKPAVTASVTSPAIDSLLAAVPGNAFAVQFVDMPAPPWTFVTGGAGFPLDAATRDSLDKELREYLGKYVGVDVSKLQYMVGFVMGPPFSTAMVVKTVSGTPKIGDATDFEGGKLWVVDANEGISVAMKGDIVAFGKDDSVRAVLETLGGKRKSVVVENAPLVSWLHEHTRGAALGFAAIAPKDLPLPPQLAGLKRVAVSLGRTGIRAIVEGEDAAITSLQKLYDQAAATMLDQVDRAHDAALAGSIPPPQGALAIISAAYAKSFAAKVKPRREGNRLVVSFDVGAAGTETMMVVSVIGVLAAVAVPAFMDYMKKSKKSEAALQLNKIGKNLKVYYLTNNALLKGDAALSPAEPCCASGTGKCPVQPDAWKDPIWQALDFQIDEPHLYQYRYHSDGTTAVVEAVGDLDCDSISITYRLEMTTPNGQPMVTITEPPPNSD